MRPTLVGVLFASVLLADAVPSISYPAGFRRWAHVKTFLVGSASPSFSGSGGLSHVYANEKALEGYRTGSFADGSVIVSELVEAKDKDGVTTEGARLRIDLMAKDSRQFADTGGWGFERFRGDSNTDRLSVAKGKLKCFECHSKQKDHDSVFSTVRE